MKINHQLIELYHQAEDYFFSSISEKSKKLGNFANAYMTGMPVADLNLVYVTGEVDNFQDRIINPSQQFFEQNNLPFVTIIPEEYYTARMENNLIAMGYQQKEQSIAMAVKLITVKIDSNFNFDDEIIIRANDKQLNEWMIPLIGAYNSTFELCSMYAARHKSALQKNTNLYHFSLYKQGKSISSITLSLNGGIARIDDVGTLPEFQGRGYATCLTTYVLLEARKLGATNCFLESSQSGFEIYQKIGFKPLFNNFIYFKTT